MLALLNNDLAICEVESFIGLTERAPSDDLSSQCTDDCTPAREPNCIAIR
jgi:hypothetical protein